MDTLKLRLQRARERWITWREALLTAWPLVLVVLLGFGAALYYVKPAPPRHLVMSTGREGGLYHAFALRYQEIFARNGITLELRPSQGSGENLMRLSRGEADIAFVQGGVASNWKGKDGWEGLYTLGSAFYEPLWVFVRDDRDGRFPQRLTDLEQKRVAVIQENNNARALAYRLLSANDITEKNAQIQSATSAQEEFAAAEALQQGRLDALFIIAAPESPIVQVLLRSPGIRLMNFTRAQAYHRHFPYLFRLLMPEGGVDLAYDFPPQDTELLAATANLAVHEDLHPALQSLMLAAMREVHGGSGFFQEAGEFPAYKNSDLPLTAAAERFHASGPPFLQRYMPFWLAVLADRFLILALPLLTLLLPMLRFAPAIYSWRIRSRICRVYGELKFLENDLLRQIGTLSPKARADFLARLDAIEADANRMPVPQSFSDLRYTLKMHIQMVRGRLSRQEV
jgi:TRAP transporter TAXI family solute receptor